MYILMIKFSLVPVHDAIVAWVHSIIIILMHANDK